MQIKGFFAIERNFALFLSVMAEKLRIDKYLWSIRLFKTRSLATDACKAGRVKKEGTNIKPSHEVKIGEVYLVSKAIEKRTIKVIELLTSRVDAKKAVLAYADLTPPEETAKYKSMFHSPILTRDRGAGRPTKKDRREIDDLSDSFFDVNEEE
jgi:ribosome-associated heat shock protein Hsp15